jgi:hypothetical protein
MKYKPPKPQAFINRQMNIIISYDENMVVLNYFDAVYLYTKLRSALLDYEQRVLAYGGDNVPR